MPHRIGNGQLSLFPTDLRNLAESIGLDWWAAKKLYDDKWLSFDPEINTTDSSSKEAEFIFLGTLVAAGCDPRMLKQLLNTLEKPYCYHLSGMYYDWAKRCWMDHDLPSQAAETFVSELEDDGDVDSLKEFKERVQEAINRMNDDVEEEEEGSDTDETSVGSYLPETCISIWLIADEDTQLIYRASARAYTISGTDEDKGRILKNLSRSDYHLAKHFSLTNFKSNIIDLQGGKRQVDGIFINSLDINLPRIIEMICQGLESEFISQPILTASGCKMYKMEIPKEPLYVLTFLFENGAGELKVRKNTLGALDAIARAFTGNPFVPLVAQEITLDETASSEHYAGTKIRTDQLKKGARVRMRNGYEAIVVQGCDGNTLIAKVFGAFTETGSVYAHNIVATEVDGQWIEVEMTEEQARFYREVKPFFDGLAGRGEIGLK